MNQHYSETDLLETYYTQPGDSLPVMMHLAECVECEARYERLERKLRGLSACETEKPEFFWARQRALILRRLPQQSSSGWGRLAAAAMLAFVISATFTRPIADRAPQRPPVTPVSLPQDPWESETLDDYQPLVEWETWVEDGGRS